MKRLEWNEAKNTWLKIERGISFEDVQTAIEEGNLLDNVAHPSQKLHKGQRVLAVIIENYVFLVPFVEDDEKLFLKTIYPSRKFTKKYLIEGRKQ